MFILNRYRSDLEVFSKIRNDKILSENVLTVLQSNPFFPFSNLSSRIKMASNDDSDSRNNSSQGSQAARSPTLTLAYDMNWSDLELSQPIWTLGEMAEDASNPAIVDQFLFNPVEGTEEMRGFDLAGSFESWISVQNF